MSIYGNTKDKPAIPPIFYKLTHITEPFFGSKLFSNHRNCKVNENEVSRSGCVDDNIETAISSG
jgi:hypothetical protein